MDKQNANNLNVERSTAARGNSPTASRKRPNRDRTSKSSAKSKRDQLIGLLSKPSGARVSVLVERLGWQPHTVRAALSGLRKQGFEIATSKSAKTGETVYAITGQLAAGNENSGGDTA